MKSLFKQNCSIKPKLQWDSEGLDKFSLKNKILYDLDNLKEINIINFLKNYLKTNKFYSTKIFIKFLLKEVKLLSKDINYDEKMAHRLCRIPTKLMNEGLIKPFNSQVFRIV